MMKSRHGGRDRVSTKAKLADELVILGEMLAAARERAKLKQSDVAAKLNLPASYLSKIENGTRRLDVVELLRIAEAMGTDPSEIVRRVTTALSRIRADAHCARPRPSGRSTRDPETARANRSPAFPLRDPHRDALRDRRASRPR